MNLADLAAPGRTPACWDQPQFFASPALDYDADDEAYAGLDASGHEEAAAAKAAAEQAAVDVCFGCPLMLACEQIDIANQSNGEPVHGVVGGRTQSERLARQEVPRTRSRQPVSIPNAQIAPGDRGPRNQVDDDLVAALTRAGKTSDEIAHSLGCSARTVSRSRKRTGSGATHHSGARISGAAPAQADNTAIASPAATTETAIEEPPAAQTLTNPFIGGRTISPAMEAVYNHLSKVGGSADLDTLIEVGVRHVDPSEAMDWWTKHNTIVEGGTQTLRGSKAATTTEERVREGARAKVYNAISATYRKGRYLDRDSSIYTFKASAMSAWRARVAAISATAN